MKYLFTLTFFILVSAIANSQYNKLIDENKKWIIETSENYNVFDNIERFFTYFKGDSIVNNITYKKLYEQYFYYRRYDDTEANLTVKESKLAGLLREDISTKKVYHLSENGNDKLLFDFSFVDKEKGDSYVYELPEWFFFNSYGTEIQEITLKDDSVRKMFPSQAQNFDLINPYENTIIEGIGSIGGIVNAYNSLRVAPPPNKENGIIYNTQYSRKIIFYSEENSIDNLIGDYVFPEKLLSTTNYKTDISIKLSPNPVSNILTLNIENFKNCNFIIHDILGKTAIPETKITTNKKTIDISELKNGVYFIRIHKNSNDLKVLKFIKKG